jgi:hypothetical protein
VSADHQATIDHGAVAGLLVYAAKVAVTEWDQLGGRGDDYCLDSVARTVEDTLAALVAYDMDRARRLVGLAEVQYIDGFVRGLVITREESFSDEAFRAVRRRGDCVGGSRTGGATGGVCR